MPPAKRARKHILTRQINTGAGNVRRILLKAKGETEAKIIKHATSGNLAASAALRDNLYADLERSYKALGGDIDRWATSQATSVAKDWHRLAIADLPRKARRLDWQTFSKRYLDDIVARVHPANKTKLAAVNAALGGMLQGDIAHLRTQTVAVRRLAAATGMTARETRKEMLARVTTERPGWKFIDKTGRQWEPENYFKMLNQTISANVARETYIETAADAGHDLLTIEGGITAESMRYPDDPCPDWAGAIISSTGATPGYPTLADAESAGMFHPRCRHYLAVVLEKVPGELEDAHKRQQATRDKAAELDAEREKPRTPKPENKPNLHEGTQKAA